METSQFASEHLTRLLNRLVFQVNATAARRDADAIHDLRVAIRRFSQGLVVLKACFASKKPKKVRRVLKEALAVAGEVRDCDIAIQLVSKAKSPGLSRLHDKLGQRRKASSAELLTLLKNWKARRLSSKWRRELEAARLGAAELPTLEETARLILPRDARSFMEWGERAAQSRASAEELHQFRIAVKKFRYSLELFTDLYQEAAPGWIERLKQIQQLLGSVNDSRTTRALIAGLGRYPKLDRSLKRRQDRKMSEFRRYWAREFTHASAIRQWIGILRHPSAAPKPTRKPPAGSGPASASAVAAGA